jgi:ABC-type Fe3+ transport system permease subunit
MDLLDILPGELAVIFGVPLVVAVVLVLVAGRGDDDRAHTRTQARYLAAICLVSLFVALFAAFGMVRGLTDLIVDKGGVESGGVPRQFRDLLDGIPGLGNLPGSGGGLSSDDADYRLAVGSALFAAAAAGVFVFHDRRARRLVPPGQIEESATGRVARAAVYGACFVAALVVLVALAKAGYGLFRVIAPDVAGRGPDDAERQLGISELLSYSLLAAGGALVFHRAWRWLPEQAPTATR